MKRTMCLKLATTLILFLLPLSSHAQPTDEEMIISRVNSLKQAFIAKDVDAIMANFSEDYESGEGDSKEEFRSGLQMVIGMGMLPDIVMDLENPQIEISGDTATFITLDASGQRDQAYVLEKEEDGIWRITGDIECTYNQYAKPYGDESLKHGDYYRSWDVHVPKNLTGSVPLVIDLHGHSSSPSEQRDFSGFESLANSEGFIVVWPYGLCGSWNSGKPCCPPANVDNLDDVSFLRKMIEEVSEQHDIDAKRIYVTGLSNGAAMAQRLANEASDLIAAVAGVSLHLLVPEAADYTPVPVITLYGNKDLDIYDPENFVTANENFNTWKTMNNCEGSYVETWRDGGSFAWTYKDCADGTEVTIVTIDEGGHMLYQGRQTEFDTTRMAWDFMKRFIKGDN